MQLSPFLVTFRKDREFIRKSISQEPVWPCDEFDRVLATLVAGYHVELHRGDPSTLSAAEVADSYQDARGTLYLSVSWRGE